jgi:dipeptidyl aminopeptidase/acylaminoacyl peptidase
MIRNLARAAAVFTLAASAAGAQRRQLTTADYDRAVRMLPQSLANIQVGGTVNPNWMPDGRFWYRQFSTVTPGQSSIIVVDPARGNRTTATDTSFIANTVGTGRGGGRGGRGGGGFGGNNVIADKTCGPNVTGAGSGHPPFITSPDGRKQLYICDWNLWVRDVATHRDRQLTTDGVKDFGYATNNAGWVTAATPVVSWSPDGRKIATQQQDERNVQNMYLIQTPVTGGHPVLKEWKYPLAGDSVVAMIHRVVIDLETGDMVRLKDGPDYHRATIGDDIDMGEYLWSPDATKLAFISTDRAHKSATAKIADLATGNVRVLFREESPTQFESRVTWQILWPTNEIIWNSERDDWSQLYLYDLNTGALKNKITTGEGAVSQIVKLDDKTRTLWYAAYGKEPGQDPYFVHYYKVGLDGRNNVSLTPDVGTHQAQLSPDGKYLVDTYSQWNVPPQTVLRDANTGRQIVALEKADISRLLATGWKPPIPVKMKSADGKWDIYGAMWRPTNFDSTKKYPIINNAYPGPQSGSLGSRAFAISFGDRQALAELGFIVVSIDGSGTPNRSKSFHDAYYGAMGRNNTLPDQMAGMQQLAARYPWIDIDKAAMWGHSGGGFITADAMLRPPFNEFFKVGISESGNHDQRMYEDDWGERYQGLVMKHDNVDSYQVEANQSNAANLKGKLFLIHGTMDNNVPPFNTLLVADALIKANKEFDLLMIPNAAHGYGAASNYAMRRRWDYFVRNLLDEEPPKDYVIPAAGGGGRGRGGPLQ